MTVFALTLAILALAMPLGASAADEKDEPRRDAARREETPAVVVIDASAAPPDTGQTHFVAADPDPGCPPGFEPAVPPLNPALGCVATDLAYVVGEPASDPDPGCPEGFEQAAPPLNPALGCLPSNAAAGAGGSHEADPDPTCPEGWVPAAPPLNPALGCIASTEVIAVESESETATFAGADQVRHPGHDDCPAGWVPAQAPLNEDLGCINNTLAATTVAGDATGGGSELGWGGDGSRHPGHGCPEGYVQKLLLKQNPDGSLTFSYGCVKEGGGIVTGPTDFVVSNTTGPDTSQVMLVGNGGSLEHPGHCAEGFVYALVLRENPDGSYTWLYTCVPDGSGPSGPDDFTSGDGGRRTESHEGWIEIQSFGY